MVFASVLSVVAVITTTLTITCVLSQEIKPSKKLKIVYLSIILRLLANVITLIFIVWWSISIVGRDVRERGMIYNIFKDSRWKTFFKVSPMRGGAFLRVVSYSKLKLLKVDLKVLFFAFQNYPYGEYNCGALSVLQLLGKMYMVWYDISFDRYSRGTLLDLAKRNTKNEKRETCFDAHTWR